ncbi:acyl carrier protein [Paenibacillus sp. yr247]|uniref:phosphopantetheine-binding protein n=1 Tax=Paenibacillus sp. yr247 TaxID=1761880 RepID=UPI0008855B5D|nr:phosphopantetheine-binding protein [Paenibacillus sp. yr247]SDO85162.1 acyl carrier protein [Paenibacillus sp. yr247]
MKDEIRSMASAVLSEVLRIPVSADHNIYRSNTEQWDSLKHLELILLLEEEFHVRFSAEQVANINCLEDIVGILGGDK